MTSRSLLLKLINTSPVGLVLDHDGHVKMVNWHRVMDISVGTVEGSSGERLFVMAIELTCGRIGLCREDNPIWHNLNLNIATQLPNAIPFEAWGPALVSIPSAPLVIYTRGPAGSA